MRTEILDLNEREIDDMLRRNNFGHFGCSLNEKPYVVPINFVYKMPFIYLYTTAGMKSQILDMNPQVCLQVEEVVNPGDWRSVVIHGNATRIIDPVERERILKMIVEANPTLTPAMGIRWTDNWIRENKEVVYRIDPSEKSGRFAQKVDVAANVAH
ncbi:MAG TPA: pyridoxamine 5'-phosphate oxidase family protein [Pyrinomonadaceae bacterium]|nr:pyridoxamine 5'-phosphate oxidase family protein [Pyrinomonadaceae bacterium]